MPIKNQEESKDNTNKTALLLFVGFFLISLSFLVYGLLKPRTTKEENNEDVNRKQVVENEADEESLSKYFEKSQNLPSNLENDKYLINDPFLNQCLDTSGDNLPAINGNTVCLR